MISSLLICHHYLVKEFMVLGSIIIVIFSSITRSVIAFFSSRASLVSSNSRIACHLACFISFFFSDMAFFASKVLIVMFYFDLTNSSILEAKFVASASSFKLHLLLVLLVSIRLSFVGSSFLITCIIQT